MSDHTTLIECEERLQQIFGDKLEANTPEEDTA